MNLEKSYVVEFRISQIIVTEILQMPILQNEHLKFHLFQSFWFEKKAPFEREEL